MKIFITLLFAFVSLYAELYNNVHQNYKKSDAERGYYFYADNKKNKKKEYQPEIINGKLVIKKDKREIPNLLRLIASEIKKTNKRINDVEKELLLIKYYINPNAPKEIMCEDGKKGMSNSRPACFDMPVITEGRNMPALAAFMKNRTLENAKNYLGVQAKLFNAATEMGYALNFAQLEGGSSVNPTDGYSPFPIGGSTDVKYIKKKTLELIKKNKEKIGTAIFIGKTPSLEKEWGFNKLGYMSYHKLGELNAIYVFINKETKDFYDNFYDNFNDEEIKKAYKNASKKIDSKLFEKYNIKITPTARAFYVDKNKTKSMNISQGMVSMDGIVDGYRRFFIFEKIFKPTDFSVEKIWEQK